MIGFVQKGRIFCTQNSICCHGVILVLDKDNTRLDTVSEVDTVPDFGGHQQQSGGFPDLTLGGVIGMSSPNIPQNSSLILNLKGNPIALKFRVSYLKSYNGYFCFITIFTPIDFSCNSKYTQVQNLYILYFLVLFVNIFFFTN